MGNRHERRLIAASGVLSIVLHGALLSIFAHTRVSGAHEDRSPDTDQFDPDVLAVLEIPPEVVPEPPRPPLLTLGIERSDHLTENWLGFAEPTPHSAAPSEVDQPALDPAPLASAAPVEEVPLPDVGTPSSGTVPPVPLVPPAEAPAEAMVTQQILGTPTDSIETRPNAEEVVDRALRGLRSVLAAGVRLIGSEAFAELPDAEEAEQTRLQESPPPPALSPPAASPFPAAPSVETVVEQRPAARTSTSPGGVRADQGSEQSEKESPAASRVQTVDVRPGRPAAAQGLDITTRRPIFTTLTHAMRSPIDVEVLATFDRSGRVADAKIVRSSGVFDVDEPVLNAVYGWTAKGPAIDAIVKNDPLGGVTLRFRIMLR